MSLEVYGVYGLGYEIILKPGLFLLTQEISSNLGLLVLINKGEKMNSLRKRGIIIFSILSLVIVACGGAEEEVVEETVEEVVQESLDSPAVTTATSVKTGKELQRNHVRQK